MDALIGILAMLINTASMLIIIWFVIGLLFAFNVVSPNNQFVYAIYDALNRLFTPVLAPIRRILPDTGAIDFSPMILLFGMNALLLILQDIRY